jgi:hypothetical protein
MSGAPLERSLMEIDLSQHFPMAAAHAFKFKDSKNKNKINRRKLMVMSQRVAAKNLNNSMTE